jgi:peptidoglycan synthetase FtsI (EC 2.4.1.129)
VAKQVKALGIKGIYESPSYKRYYPEGSAAAQLIGFSNIEGQGQDGMELALQARLAGHPGVRKVVKDRLGNVIEDVSGGVRRSTGRMCACRSTARFSISPTRRSSSRWWTTRPRTAARW